MGEGAMLIYLTALAFEAVPLIRRLGLVGKESCGGFRIYGEREKDYPAGDVFLIVTGSGLLQSSAGAAYILGRLGAGEGDVLVNFGIAGAAAAADISNGASLKPGDLVLPVKYVREGERDVYPDLLFPADILPGNVRKGVAVTVNGAASEQGNAAFFKASLRGGESILQCLPAVYDNEAYGVIRTAGMLLGPQGAISLKVVSDNIGDAEKAGGVISKEAAERIADAAAEALIPFAEAFHAFISGKCAGKEAAGDLPPGLLKLWEEIADSLDLSFARGAILKNLMRRDCFAGTDAFALYARVAEEAAALSGDRKASLEYFEALLKASEYI